MPTLSENVNELMGASLSFFNFEFSLSGILSLVLLVWIFLMIPSIIAILRRSNVEYVLTINFFLSIVAFLNPIVPVGFIVYLFLIPDLYKAALE